MTNLAVYGLFGLLLLLIFGLLVILFLGRCSYYLSKILQELRKEKR